MMRAKRWSRLTRLWHENKYGYLFLAPWLIGFLGLTILPMLASFVFAFTSYNFFGPLNFIGLRNFVVMFTEDPRYIKAVQVTGLYVGFGVLFQLVFALTLALVLNQGIPGVYIFRGVYYLPALLGGSVAVAILWRQVFGMQGLVNQLFQWLGLEQMAGVSWVSHPDYAAYTLVLLRVWQFGSPMIIFLAGLKQIPGSYYESASIDGAGRLSQFFRITIPLLTPIILFNTIMQIISAFQSFTDAYVLGRSGGSGSVGGTMDSLLLYTIYLYQRGFTQFKMGYASAMAWTLLATIAVLTAILFRTSRSWVHYES